MAQEVLSDILAALPEELAPDLYKQWNRLAVTAAGVEAKPGAGRQAAFDVEFSGSVDADTQAEGSDVAGGEFDSDIDEPAVLAWALYRAAFNISSTALSAAMSSSNAPAELRDLFGNRVIGKAARIASKINRDMWTGTGLDGSSNPTIVGYSGGALAATGSYAGLARATYSEWAGNVLGNGGTPRALTMDLLAQAEEQIYEASGEDFTSIRTSPGVLRKYEGLFEQTRQEQGAGTYSAGASNFLYKGKPVIRDKDCPAGELVFENRNYVGIQFLPAPGSDKSAVMDQMRAATGQSGSEITAAAIPVQVQSLGKTGNSLKIMVWVECAMCVKKPNSFALVEDISEA
jgi:hypothetical protein